MRRISQFLLMLQRLMVVLFYGALFFGVAGLLLSPSLDLHFEEPTTERAVGVIDIKGVIEDADPFMRKLGAYEKDERIKAVVVRINSPGGSVGASEEMYRALRRLQTKKPVVCSMSDSAASGGLYASMGCQKIFAIAGTITGSIGVIAQFPQLKTVEEKVGISFFTVKTGKYKDVGSPHRDVTPDDQAFLQSFINKSYEEFIRVIADSRKLSVETVRQIADGRVLTGAEAKDLGLVDALGGVHEAAHEALVLAKLDGEAELIRFKALGGFLSGLEDARTYVKGWMSTTSPSFRVSY